MKWFWHGFYTLGDVLWFVAWISMHFYASLFSFLVAFHDTRKLKYPWACNFLGRMQMKVNAWLYFWLGFHQAHHVCMKVLGRILLLSSSWVPSVKLWLKTNKFSHPGHGEECQPLQCSCFCNVNLPLFCNVYLCVYLYNVYLPLSGIFMIT